MSCGEDDEDLAPSAIVLTTNFLTELDSWEYGFADYSTEMTDTMDLEGGLRSAAETPDGIGSAFELSGSNSSDDLFMFLRRELRPTEGIRPLTEYRVTYRVTFWSQAQSNCVGIGGPPGESVYMKVGLTDEQPMAVLNDGTYRMNVDKGNQSTGGPAASVAGNIANGQPCDPDDAEYRLVELVQEHPETVRADRDGALWLLVGTDSGFEGRTTLYYQTIEAVLVPVLNEGS